MHATREIPGVNFVAARAATGCWIVLTALVLAVGAWMLLPLDVVASLSSEGALVEESTAVLFFVAAAATLSLRRNAVGLALVAALCTLFLAFGARELDLHRAWTHGSMLKVSFYLGPAPLVSKLISVAVLALFATSVIYLLRVGVAWLPGALRKRSPVAVTIFMFILALVASKLLDRSISVLHEDFGVFFSPGVPVLTQAMEEMLELTLPLLGLLGILQHRQPRAPEGGFSPRHSRVRSH
jgi:hypothetical protein